VTARRLVSIVIPCYDEVEVFPLLRRRLERTADDLASEADVEMIFVDDGSDDGTWDAIREFARADARVRGVLFSRNFGHQFAITCGYDLARGDAVVSIDADLQDPPELIPEMVNRWRAGADIVYAVRNRRRGESRLKLWTAALFYRVLHLLGARFIRQDSGDFRLMSRRALMALGSMRETHRFIRGMVGWIGFRQDEIRYDRDPRAGGRTKYPLSRMIRLAFDASVSFSMVPLRIAYATALLLSLVIFGYLAYTAIRIVFFGEELVRGWLSLILATTGFGALTLVCVGLLGEYVGRIYEQVKARPLYWVAEAVGRTTEREPTH